MENIEEKKVECVMCGSNAEYLAEAKYKSGIIQEPLCKTHKEVNQQIEDARK